MTNLCISLSKRFHLTFRGALTRCASPINCTFGRSPFLEAAEKGLARIFKNKPVLIGCGGSIPVVGSIQQILGFDSLLVGFDLDDDRVHSPNEKFEWKCYEMGVKSHAAMLAELARAQ